jgi:hypothetical protein
MNLFICALRREDWALRYYSVIVMPVLKAFCTSRNDPRKKQDKAKRNQSKRNEGSELQSQLHDD